MSKSASRARPSLGRPFERGPAIKNVIWAERMYVLLRLDPLPTPTPKWQDKKVILSLRRATRTTTPPTQKMAEQTFEFMLRGCVKEEVQFSICDSFFRHSFLLESRVLWPTDPVQSSSQPYIIVPVLPPSSFYFSWSVVMPQLNGFHYHKQRINSTGTIMAGLRRNGKGCCGQRGQRTKGTTRSREAEKIPYKVRR